MRAIIIGAALLLTACSEAVSQAPLLAEADAVGAPPFRDGVWRAVESSCKVRERDSAWTWPKCAAWGVVSGHDLASVNRGAAGLWEHRQILMSPGQPIVVQGAPVDDSQPYGFFGLRPTRTDEAGRIVEAQLWPVLCGPRAKPSRLRPRLTGFGVRAGLFDDMTSDGDLACIPASVEPLRAAAKNSEAFVEPLVVRWVSDQLN